MLLRQASSSRFREMRPVFAWISCASSLPAARCSSPSACSSRSASRTGSPTRHRCSRSTRSRCAERRPSSRARYRVATRDLVGRSLVAIDAGEVEGTLRALPEVAGVSVDRAFPNTLVVKVAPERPVAVIRSGTSAWLATGAGKVVREIEVGTQRGMPRLWLRRGATIRVGGQIPAGLISATRALAEARAAGLGGRVKGVRMPGEELTLVLAPRHGDPPRPSCRCADEARHRPQGARARRRRRDVHRRQRSAETRRRLTFKSQVEVESGD